MLDVKVVTWPRGEDSLFMPVIAGLLAGRGQTLPPPALRDDGAEPVDIPAGTRLVVEYEEFCDAAAMRFVAAGETAEGTAGGTAGDVDAFLRFASADFAAHRDFMLAWGDHEASDGRIVVPRAALRADPGSWLAWISGTLDPALLLHGAALEEACDHVRRHAADPAPAVLAKLDAGLIDKLHRIKMDRETVSGVFLEVLGRPPRDEGILRFQAMPDTQALRTALMDSAEYRKRQSMAVPATAIPDATAREPSTSPALHVMPQDAGFPSFEAVAPEVLRTEAFLRASRKLKTPLGWPRAQVFVSRKARVIYCPIGKVACTFLKKQMVRISDVAHADVLPDDVARLTDNALTGLQLSDYPEAEALAMIADPEMLRFAVLRDPADRLLSAYVEKFVIGRTDLGNIVHTRSIVAAVQGNDEPDFAHGISFRQFVLAISFAPAETLDPHWRPQVHYLSGINWDRLFALEQIDTVVDLLEARSGVRLPRQPQNVTHSGSGTDHSGASDLLPAEIMAQPRIGKASFFDPDLTTIIQTCYAKDADLHRAALAHPQTETLG